MPTAGILARDLTGLAASDGLHRALSGHGAILAHGDERGPLTVATALSIAEPFTLLTLGLVISAGLYAWGLWRLRRSGIHWPLVRTVFWAAGLVSIASVTVTGIGAYDDTLLSIHMIQHMMLAMISPIFLALGAPVTLALRTLPRRPRRYLLAFVHSRYVRFLTFPLVAFTLYVATPFVLYFSPLYQASLEHEWLHEWVHIHFVLTGCVFFFPLLGLDPLPGRLSYPLRALLMFLTTPFHTVLGLTVMQSSSLLAGDYYPSLGLDWVNPHVDQRLGGGILWAGGEIVSVTMVAVLVVQWMRHSDREARRIDRALDRLEAEQAARAGMANGAIEASGTGGTDSAQLNGPDPGRAGHGAVGTASDRRGSRRPTD